MRPTEVCSRCGQALADQVTTGFCPACERKNLPNPIQDSETIPPVASAMADAATVPPDANLAESATPLPASSIGNSKDERVTPSGLAGGVGQSFGDYELQGEIARGGMGVVYRARQKKLNRNVAIKMILAGQLASESDVQRFRTEAEAAAQLEHSGIVPIYDIGEINGQHFFSMPLIEGVSLAERLYEGPLTTEEAVGCLVQVANAVHYAHEQGIVHRDLKPANILLDQSGSPKVMDFGLAKNIGDDSGMTATGQVMGTAGYMPPEQARGNNDAIDRRSDVYSLGAILYCLLTGRPPFQAATPMETLIQVLEREPIPPQQLNSTISTDLQTITLKCLQKNPSRRYDSAEELAEELQRVIEGRPILARPVSTTEYTWRWCKRNKYVAGLLAGLAVSIVAGVVGVSVQWRRAEAALGMASIKVVELTTAENDLAEELYVSNLLRGDALQLAGQLGQAEQIYSEMLEQPVPDGDRRAWWRLWKYYWEHPRDGRLPVRGGQPCVSQQAGIIAVTDADQIHLLKLNTYEVETELVSPHGRIHQISISPSGRWLIASHGSLTELCLWDLQEPKQAPQTFKSKLELTVLTDLEKSVLKQFAGQPKALMTRALTSSSQVHFVDDDRFVQYDWNGLHEWSIKDGVQTIIGGTRAGVLARNHRLAAVSPDGLVVWMVSNQELIRFDITDDTAKTTFVGATADTLETFPTPGNDSFRASVFAINPDATRLAVLESEAPNRIRLWDLTTNNLLTVRENGPSMQGDRGALTFSHDSSHIAFTENRKVTLLSAETLETINVFDQLPEHSAFAAVVEGTDRQKQCLISERPTSVLTTRDMQIGIHPFNTTPRVSVQQRETTGRIQLAPNGIAYCVSLAAQSDGKRVLSRLEAGRVIAEVPIQTDSPRCPIAVAADGKTVALVDRTNTLIVFDGVTLKSVQQRKLNAVVAHAALAVSPNGSRIAYMFPDGNLHLANTGDLEDETVVESPAILSEQLQFSPSGKWVASLGVSLSGDLSGEAVHELQIYDAVTGEVVGSVDNPRKQPVILFSSTDDQIYVADDKVTVFSIPDLEQLAVWESSVDGIQSLTEDPETNTLFCGSASGSIAVMDTLLQHENVVIETSSATKQLRFEPSSNSIRFVDGDCEHEVQLSPSAKRIELNRPPKAPVDLADK